MKKISGQTFVYKKFLPSILYMFFGIVFVGPFFPGGQEPSLLGVALPAGFAIISYILFVKNLLTLADVVYDDGDELIFRKGKLEQHVKLSDIVNINHLKSKSPEVIEIYVKADGPIGKVLVFMPHKKFFQIKRDSLVQELNERVGHAKK